MPKAPLSQPGRYAELDVDQLADTVERSHDRHELPNWELVFELSRRMIAAETSDARPGPVGSVPPGVGASPNRAIRDRDSTVVVCGDTATYPRNQ